MSSLVCGAGFSHWSSALVSASSYQGGNSPQVNSTREFKYDRASPAVRWPNWHEQQEQEKKKQPNSGDLRVTLYQENPGAGDQASLAGLTTQLSVGKDQADGEEEERDGGYDQASSSLGESEPTDGNEVGGAHALPQRSDYFMSLGKKKRGRMSRIALLKATDWRERVQRLGDAVYNLPSTNSVADLLHSWPEQLSPTDYCFVVKQVGSRRWQRALELFEWLNMRHWYTPNNRMLSAILGVLGRANQVDLAEEIFQRVEPELGDCVQVFNAMLSVHARHGNWGRMQTLLGLMLDKGCERDLVTFNTLISGRAKAGLHPGMAMELLREIWQEGLRPDTVTYNTLISTSSLNKCYEDAVLIYEEMKEQRCQPDIWTYNSMISVYGRCGLDEAAEEVYHGMKKKGFAPDAITYNSILFAYAKKGRLEDVDAVRKEMERVGCREDVITFNTMIDMYGKKNLPQQALDIYERMKRSSSRKPDRVTFVVLIDGLGKAGLASEAERVFNEMTMEANLQPSLNIFCAMICAYVKVAMYDKAANMYQTMLKAGIQPDQLAYSVMLDVYLNLGQATNVLSIYEAMMPRYKPGLVQCGLMLQVLKREGMTSALHRLSEQIHEFGLNPAEVCCIFAKVGLCDAAEKSFLMALSRGLDVDASVVDQLLDCFKRADMLSDAQRLFNSISATPGSERFHEQLICVLSSNQKIEEAKTQLSMLRASGRVPSRNVFRSLIVAFERAGLSLETVQITKEMTDLGYLDDVVTCKSALLAYCKSGMPDEGCVLLQRIQTEFGGAVQDANLHLSIIKSYIKLHQWEKSESLFLELKETRLPIFPRDYDSLLLTCAQSGRAQQVLRFVNHMAEHGLTHHSSRFRVILDTLLKSGRLVDVDEVYQRLQEAGFDLDMETHMLMLMAYARNGSAAEAKTLYSQLRSKGYILQVQIFNVLIGLYSKVGWVEDAEGMMKDMKESGFQPNVYCYNAMLSVYGKSRNFKKAAQVFQGMQTCGCAPDTVTYNTLIHLYSRCLHIQEAHALLQQMKQAGCTPDLLSYTLLLTACGQLQMWEAAEVLFKDLQGAGVEPDEATYHLMIDIFRRAGKPELAQNVVTEMKERGGFEPSTSTMHMLLDSYGKGGQTEGAVAVFDGMVEAGMEVDATQYTSLIDGYLKEQNYEMALSMLSRMTGEGVLANYATWTCVIGGASKCEKREDALMLLRGLRDIGFPLPLQLLLDKDSLVLLELDCLIDRLQDERPGAAAGLLNVIQDLTWAFHKRATAAHIFHLAVQKNVYEREFSRVQDEDWAANLCRLSPGAALVALTTWLISMQEAALRGSPRPSKSVLLTVGSNKRSNRVSLSRTIKSHLWEMGAPFLLSRTREGTLIGKGHSVQMWLKDSPKCIDLDLENQTSLPEFNSMQVHQGAWLRRGMVPVFKQIEESMGPGIRPKKFMRLAEMHSEKRVDAITSEISGRAAKLAKDKIRKSKVKVSLPVRKSLPSTA